MQNIIKSKPVQLGIVLFLVASIIITGTYAWNGFFGKATMGTPKIIPDEVTLFDFSDQLGEIYVVNNDHYDMLVRIKFQQNLRIGGTSIIPGTLADDPSTWPIESAEIRKYYSPVFGKAVIPMQEWKRQGSPIGDYWIADTNGWYYYAKKLAPGEATRTLISEIAPNQFNELVNEEYQTATFLQAVSKNDLADLLRLDANSFTNDGKLTMKYLNGEMVEFVA